MSRRSLFLNVRVRSRCRDDAPHSKHSEGQGGHLEGRSQRRSDSSGDSLTSSDPTISQFKLRSTSRLHATLYAADDPTHSPSGKDDLHSSKQHENWSGEGWSQITHLLSSESGPSVTRHLRQATPCVKHNHPVRKANDLRTSATRPSRPCRHSVHAEDTYISWQE